MALCSPVTIPLDIGGVGIWGSGNGKLVLGGVPGICIVFLFFNENMLLWVLIKRALARHL